MPDDAARQHPAAAAAGADPLASARNYRQIRSVIKDGKVVNLAALPVAPIISTMKVVK